MYSTSRRGLLRLAASAVALSSTSLNAIAADRTVKVGTLKLIHGITPYFYEKFVPAVTPGTATFAAAWFWAVPPWPGTPSPPPQLLNRGIAIKAAPSCQDRFMKASMGRCT